MKDYTSFDFTFGREGRDEQNAQNTVAKIENYLVFQGTVGHVTNYT